MEPTALMHSSALSSGIAVGGGLTMAVMRLFGMPSPPAKLAMAPTVLAGVGMSLLAYVALTVGIAPMAQFALGLFVLAAAMGAAMNLLYQRKQLPLPIQWMLAQAFVAAVGLVLLLVSIYGPEYIGNLRPMIMNNT